jgi:hypothetical protein
MDTKEQLIWYRHELPIFEELLKYKQGLIDDFMKGYTTLEDAVLDQSINSITPEVYDNTAMSQAEGMLVSKDKKTLKWHTNFEGWKSAGLKNIVKIDGKVLEDWEIDSESAKKFPTGMSLLNNYREDMFGVVYSAIAPHTILQRHVGPENINGEYVRIHMPLIVPEGDIFLEVQGQEVRWDDIFAFNNQYLHSAHNYSDEWRLIMLIDLSRKACGLPPGIRFSEGGLERQKPFVRGWQF